MIEQRKVSELKLSEKNPRSISKENLKSLKTSITEFHKMLSLRPIIVDEDNVILAGSMRYRAAKELKFETLPVMVAKGYSKDEKRQLVLKDNVHNGAWNLDKLFSQFEHDLIYDNIPDIPRPEVKSTLSMDDEHELAEKISKMAEMNKRSITFEFQESAFKEVFQLVALYRKKGDVGKFVLGLLQKAVNEKTSTKKR